MEARIKQGLVGRKVRTVAVGGICRRFLRQAQDRLFDSLRSLRMTVCNYNGPNSAWAFWRPGQPPRFRRSACATPVSAAFYEQLSAMSYQLSARSVGRSGIPHIGSETLTPASRS